MANKKIKNKNGNIKKIIQVSTLLIGLMVVFAVILFLVRTPKQSLEDKLVNKLTNMGEEFYTEFYYTEVTKGKTATEVSEFLSKFKDVGIKINLDNLSRYNNEENLDKIKDFKNEKGEKCNITSTRAIIYPKSPYGKKDYTIKVELDCGFETTKETK